MKDFVISHTDPHNAFAGIQRSIEDATLALSTAFATYLDFTSTPGPAPFAGRPQAEARAATLTPGLLDALHGQTNPAECGLSKHPCFIRMSRRARTHVSCHAELRTHALHQSVLEAVEELRMAIGVVPVLGHDALQVDIASYVADKESPHLLRLSLDGIALQSGPGSPQSVAAEMGRNLASLCLLSENSTRPWLDEWNFYTVQNHLIRAPGPGWAWLKLQSLIQCRQITSDDLGRFLAGAPPPIAKIEPKSSILKDLAFEILPRCAR